MIQIEKVNLVDENGEFFGSIEGYKFQKIGSQFFEIINSKRDSNFKYLQMASLFMALDEDIACYCFNKIDRNKLNVLEQLMYVTVHTSLVD